MRVENVGELVDRGMFWRLNYDDCGHVQDFAHEGLSDIEQAAQHVRRHLAQCLICASSKKRVLPQASNVDPDGIHVVLSPVEISRVIDSLRQTGDDLLAQRFARILRQTQP